jgi:hypothetical protein
MSEAVRYTDKLIIRCETGLMTALNEGARKHGTKQSEFVRQIIRDGLLARGIDPFEPAAREVA